MPTTTYTTPTLAINAIGARTDAAGGAVTDTTVEEFRLNNVLFTEGYLTTNAFKVNAQTVPNMTVKVGSDVAKADHYIVAGEVAGQGNYIVRLDVASQNVTIDAADASQTRTDEIYLVVRDNPYDGSARALPQLAYRKGDLGGANPGVDAAWRASVILARVTVAAAATTITAGVITDLRTASSGAGISKSLIDAKGDLIVGSANDTPAKFAVDTNGKMLMTDSAQSLGMKWALPDYDVLGETVLGAPAASISFGSIPQTHRHLTGVISGISPSGFTQIYTRINGDGAFHYDTQVMFAEGTAITATRLLSWNAMELGIIGDTDPSTTEFIVADYTAILAHVFSCRSSYRNAAGWPVNWHSTSFNWSNTSPITSMNFLPAGGGNFDTGTKITLLGIGAL